MLTNNDAQSKQQKNLWKDCSDNMLTVTPLLVNNDIIELKNAVLFSRPLNANSVMEFSTIEEDHEESHHQSNIFQTIVVSTLDSMSIRFIGEWSIEIFSISQVTTLFSFLDHQANHRNNMIEQVAAADTSVSTVLLSTERHHAILLCDEERSFMTMLISEILNTQDGRLKSLFSFIRAVESYWISHFLLSQILDDAHESDACKIYNASKVYGVSESYFRKLCYQAFSRGPKKQLRLWRAAHSALQLIEKDKSISTIAGDNGYASSSHLSTEIKHFFGITPKEFKKLEGLLHE